MNIIGKKSSITSYIIIPNMENSKIQSKPDKNLTNKTTQTKIGYIYLYWQGNHIYHKNI
jgi:ADP-dependent phosphofructokinase/glucokinase